MSIPISPVTNSQSFGVWLQRTNQIAQIISANVVTSDFSIDGSVTTGNSYVNGFFGTNTLSAVTGIGGGTGRIPAPLSIFTNTVFANNTNNYLTIDPFNITASITANITFTALNLISNTSNVIFNTTTANINASNVQINANVVISNNLSVGANVNANNLIIGSNTVSNTLNVTGNSSLNVLNANGIWANGIIVNNAVSIGTSLTVVANVSSNNITIAANATIGTLNVAGNTILANTYTPYANVTTLACNNAIVGNVATTTLNVSGTSNVQFLQANTANVAYDVIVGRNLYVSGNTTTSGSQAANGNIIPVLNNTFLLGNTSNRFIISGSSGNFNNLTLDNGGVLTSTYAFASISQQSVDTFNASIYRSASYLIQMTDGTNYHLTNILLIHDGSMPYLTEFGTVLSGINLGVIDAVINTGYVNLTIVPANANVTVKIIRKTINI